jgi:DNA modification methylase
VAAAKTGRHSIGIEVDDYYFDLAHKRIANETSSLFSQTTIFVRKAS